MGGVRGGDRRLVRRGRLQRPIQLVGLVCIPAILAAAVLGGGLGRLPSAQAQQGGWQEDSGAVRHIVVTLYKSRTLRLDKPFASAVVGSPDIVDALPMSDRALYIQGKKVGTTNISVFDTQMRMVGVLDVEVTPDVGTLQERIRSSTGSGGIRVGSSNGQIVLSGTARDAVAAERAMQVARSMVPEGGSVVNAMKVAPSQQVLLKVRFMEVARSASRELGVNWFGATVPASRGFSTGVGGVTHLRLGLPQLQGSTPWKCLVPSPGAATLLVMQARCTWSSAIYYCRHIAVRRIAFWRCARQSRRQQSSVLTFS